MHVCKPLVTAIWLSAAVAAVRPAVAQPRRPVHPAEPAHADQPTSGGAVAEARRAYDEGTAQYAAGRYQEALTDFLRAYELRANPVVLLPIIECRRQLGQTAEELTTIEQYLHDAPTAPTHLQLEARATEIRQLPVTVRVSSTPPGASIAVDGHPTGHHAPTGIDLAPGHHVLTLTLDGYNTSEQPVEVAPAHGGPIDVTLATAPVVPATPQPSIVPVPTPIPAPAQTLLTATPEPSSPHPSETESQETSSGWTPLVITSAIVAGSAFVASAVLGGMALNDSSSYAAAPTSGLYDRQTREALFCDVGWIVGLMVTGVGVVAYFSSRGHHDDTAAPHAAVSRWRLTPSGVGVTF